MSKRRTVLSTIFLASVLATLCLLGAAVAASVVSPVPGAPLKGVDVKLGKNPGGALSKRTTGPDGQIDLSDLAPGSYWMEIAPLSNAQKAANAGGEEYSYLTVTIGGPRLVGGTKTRSLDVKKWEFANPRKNTARTTPTPDTYSRRIEFEIGSVRSGSSPQPTLATIVKSKSNITNN
jgi:hypothetical protein